MDSFLRTKVLNWITTIFFIAAMFERATPIPRPVEQEMFHVEMMIGISPNEGDFIELTTLGELIEHFHVDRISTDPSDHGAIIYQEVSHENDHMTLGDIKEKLMLSGQRINQDLKGLNVLKLYGRRAFDKVLVKVLFGKETSVRAEWKRKFFLYEEPLKTIAILFGAKSLFLPNNKEDFALNGKIWKILMSTSNPTLFHLLHITLSTSESEESSVSLFEGVGSKSFREL